MTPHATTASRARITRLPAVAAAALLAAVLASLVPSFTVGGTQHKATTTGPTASQSGQRYVHGTLVPTPAQLHR